MARLTAPPRIPSDSKTPRWLTHPSSIVASILVLAGGATYACTTVRAYIATYDLLESGAKLAHEHAPLVAKLPELADIVRKQDDRIEMAERTLAAIRHLKEIEQEHQYMTREFQRSSCAAGKLDYEACIAQGFPVPNPLK